MIRDSRIAFLILFVMFIIVGLANHYIDGYGMY